MFKSSTTPCLRKLKLNISNSLLQLVSHLLPQRLQSHPHILGLPPNLLQQGGELLKGVIFGVVEPGLDEDAVVRVEFEVLGHVVDDDGFGEGAADQREVFDEVPGGVFLGVLAVEAVRD